MKTQDAPVLMRPFLGLMQQLIPKYDIARVWDDFLTLTLGAFNTPAPWGNLYFDQLDEQCQRVLASYPQKEHAVFTQLINEYFYVMIRRLTPYLYREQLCKNVFYGIQACVNAVCACPDGDINVASMEATWQDTERARAQRPWYDALGDFYMELTSKYKSSRLGQFFTPDEVCTLMTHFTLGDFNECDEHGRRYDCNNRRHVNEPACGSGRMVLSMHAKQPGASFFVLQDIDPICCKMAAINMLLHGVPCEVICSDSLNPDDYRFGYRINRWLHAYTAPVEHLQMMPHLRVLPEKESFHYKFWQARLAEVSRS